MSCNRIHWIDWSKCLLMYLVVLAHYGNIGVSVDNLICHFHMPAFFIISGYLHKPLGVKNSFVKNIKRLLVPAVLFSVLCWGFYFLIDILKQHPISFDNNVLKPLLGIVCYDKDIAEPQCGVIWFLEVLFICNVLLDVLIKFGHRSVIAFCLVSVAMTGVWSAMKINDFRLLFYVQRACISFPFVALGYYANRMAWMDRISKTRFWVLAIILVLYIIGVCYNGRVGIYSYQFGHNILVYLTVTLLGCFCFFLSVNKIKIGGVNCL